MPVIFPVVFSQVVGVFSRILLEDNENFYFLADSITKKNNFSEYENFTNIIAVLS
jgi:hypothetical protein